MCVGAQSPQPRRGTMAAKMDDPRNSLFRNAESGARPLETNPAIVEVIDMIADIEMQRQVMEKKAGLAAACSSALRKLHRLLEREKEVPLHGSAAGHPENVEAVTIEIGRVKQLAVAKRQGPTHEGAHTDLRKASWRNAHRNPARNKGRRTMGRAGGR
jgi:hypothetical protein